MVSVSTAYNGRNHESGRAVIEELQALGFGAFELGVNLTEAMVAEIETMLPGIEITSLHNYCPLPESPRERGSGDFYFLSSPDPHERRRAVDATMRTVEWAKRLGAKAVVLHMGRVEMPDQFVEIITARLAGRQEEADELLRQDLMLREKRRGRYLEAALLSVSEIAERVAGSILLGIETRVGHTEIPSFDEIGLFMDALSPSAGGYWHDFGHAQFNEMLGVAKHEDFLKRYGSRMVGMHIHDMLGRNDHRPLTQSPPDKDVARARAESLGMQFVDLSTQRIDEDACKTIPEHIAKRHNLIAVFKNGTKLTVAVSDPGNPLALQDARLASGLQIVAVLATEDDISEAIRRCYRPSVSIEDDEAALRGQAEQAPAIRSAHTIDFPNLLRLVPGDAIPVLEIHGSATGAQLVRSREIVESLLGRQ